jgi:hypothetical protein
MNVTTRALGPLVLMVPVCLQGCSSGAADALGPAVGDDGGRAISTATADGGPGGGLQTSSSPVEAGDTVEDATPATPATPDGTDAPTVCAASTVTASEVVFIGDSFIAEPTSDVAIDLETIWQRSGAPGYSAVPRYYQLVGTDMKQIAAQYTSAHQANADIKVVIGDGGGNDVLVDDRSCLTQAPPANAQCLATLENAISLADQMITQMEADGVQHFVYFFYPHEPTQGLFQGTAPAINDSLDYTEPLAKTMCEKHPICTFVSFREAMGEAPGAGYVDPNGYIKPLDVHPSTAGSQFFAGVLWSAMQSNCILTL